MNNIIQVRPQCFTACALFTISQEGERSVKAFPNSGLPIGCSHSPVKTMPSGKVLHSSITMSVSASELFSFMMLEVEQNDSVYDLSVQQFPTQLSTPGLDNS